MAISQPGQGSSSGPGLNVLVANIDADPALEIIASNGGVLGAWNSDSSSVSGWPVNGPSGYVGLVAAGQLNPVIPGMEVVAVYSSALSSTHEIIAYAGNGSTLSGFPVNLSVHISSAPILANITGDNRDEIIVSTQDGKLYVYLADGQLALGWPVQMSGQKAGIPIVVDIDGNGDLEVAVTTLEGGSSSNANLYAYQHDGVLVSGYPVTFRRDNTASAYLVAGDIDGDGQVELVIPGLNTNNASLIRIFGSDGLLEREILMPTFHIQQMSAPSLGDMDGDGIPEIIMQLASGVTIVRGDGTNFPGWPQSMSGWPMNTTAGIADITGDHIPEIITVTQRPGDCRNGDLHIYNRSGSQLNEFHKTLPIGHGAVPAIADIDQDGRNEIVIMANSYCGSYGNNSPFLWVFDTDNTSGGLIQWGQFGNGAGHTGVYKAPQPTFVDLAVSMTDSDDPIIAGGTTTYSIQVKNQGSSMASHVQVNNTLPSGVTLVEATSSVGVCTPTPGTFTCQIGKISNGGMATIDIVVKSDTPGSITNMASVSADQSEPDLSNNVASQTTSVLPGTDLALTYTPNQARYTSGDNINLTATVTNQGLIEATGIQLTEVLPTGLVYLSNTSSQGTYDSVPGIWNIGTLGVGASATLQLNAVVVATTISKTLSSRASISAADQADPTIGNNTVILSIPIDIVDLAVTMTSTPVAPTDPWPAFTYQLSLKNNGDTTASNVRMNITLPPTGARIDAFGGSQGTFSNGVWTVGSVAAGATATYSFQMIANAGTSGQTLTAQAGVQHVDQLDKNTANDTASAFVVVNGVDFSVTNSVTPSSLSQGSTVTYTFRVQRIAANPITNAQVSAALPSGMSYISSTMSQGTYDSSTGIWQTGAISGTTAAELNVTAMAGAGTGGRTITTTAQLTTTPTDYNLANNTASSIFSVTGADLRLQQTVNSSIPAENDLVTFMLTVSNLGPNSTSGVIVNDLLPNGLTYQSHSAPAGTTYNPTTGDWTVGSLNYPTSPASRTLSITAHVNSGMNGTKIDNLAQITTSGLPDPVNTNNSATGTISVGGSDVSLTMLANSSQVGEGSILTYTIRAQVLSHKTASGVLIEDILPAGLTYTSSMATVGSYDSATGIWNLGNIPADTVVTLTLNTIVNSGATATNITNTARITHTEYFDPNTVNNSASLTVVVGLSDLSITQSVDDTTPDPGTNVAYTIQVINPAPFLARDVVVKDLLPDGLTYVSGTPSSGTYDNLTGIWSVGDIASVGNASLSLTGQVAGNYHGQSITNTASIVSAANPDSNPFNNQIDKTITVNAVNLAVSITDSADLVYTGGSYSYTISITNSGTLNATGVHISAALPSLVMLNASNTSQGSGCNTSEGLITCDLGNLVIGSSATITLNVQGLPDQSGLATLTATVAADQPEIIIANNSDTETTGLNILTVNAEDDVNDGVCSAAHCSLREAMLVANALVGVNTISFNIPGTGSHTILPLSALPTQTQAVIIDGTTQPNYAGTPLIEVDGSSAGVGEVPGLYLQGGTSTVRGLAITGFSGDGIRLETNGGNTIQGNYIGIRADGINQWRNQLNGIYINNQAGNNVIGGTSHNERNVVSGNFRRGIYSFSSDNTIQGNYVGVTVSGNEKMGNLQGGISISGSNNLVGGTVPGSRNIISGNGGLGLGVGGSNNRAQGNYIGLDVTGILNLGNEGSGIAVGGTNHLIGGTTSGAGNIIAGNHGYGIDVDTSIESTPFYITIQGNWIGTDISGIQPIPNTNGIRLSASNNLVGGITPGAGNIISSSINYGIQIYGNTNSIQGNLIGTDVTGTLPRANSIGILVRGQNNVIGGTMPGARNVISANEGRGIWISTTYPAGNIIQGNYIGTDITGTQPLGNGDWGIRVESNAAFNTIGGTETGAGNRIAFNGQAGVGLNSSNTTMTVAVLGNEIFNNGELGIDLTVSGISGVTANDPGDIDTGPNSKQNYPVLSLGELSNETLSISGTLDSTANSTFHIEFFSNRICDTSGYGEGEKLIGSANILTDASGIANFSVDLNNPMLIGQYITATATNSSNQTSEFSACATLNGSDLTLTGTSSAVTSDVADTVTYTLNLRNDGPLAVSNVVVAAALPAGMTYQSDNGGGSYNPINGEWTIESFGVGNSVLLQISTQVAEGTGGTTISFTPRIQSASESDFNSANNSVSIQVIVGMADLEIGLETDHHAPNVGDTIQLFTVIDNNGPGTASVISVSSVIPDGLTYVSHLTTQGSYDPVTGLWTFTDLAKQAQASLTVTVKVDNGTEGMTIDGTATITNLLQSDPLSTNNTDSLSLQVGIADLGVSSMIDHSNPKPGDEINLTIILTNDGPSAATGLQITSQIPSGITFLNAETSKGAYNLSNGHWDLAELEYGEEAILVLNGRVDVAAAGSTLTGQANVLSAEQVDPNASNDASAVQINVQPKVDLSLTLEAQTQIIASSQQVSYTVSVTNLSDSHSISGVAIQFKIPTQLAFISAAPGTGIYDPSTGIWAIGNLVSQETTALTVLTTEHTGNTHAYVSATAMIVSSSLSDPNPTNNTATGSVTLAVLLPRPNPTLPLDGISTAERRPNLVWDDIPGAVTYQIQMGITTSFANTIDNLTENSYTPSIDLANTTYYWHVRAISESGTPSPWSLMRSFIVLSLPDAKPELGYHTSSDINLSWSSVNWAIGYELEINTDRNFSEPNILQQEMGPSIQSATITLPSGTYYWRIRAKRNSIEWGAWTAPTSFTISMN